MATLTKSPVRWIASVVHNAPDDIRLVYLVSIAAKYNGGCPDRDIFDVDGRPECVFDYLLTVPNEIVEWYDDSKDRLPAGVYPFATDPFGNAICFDYRKGPRPKVVFWDHEATANDPRQVLPIAESFTAFLKNLYEL